MSQFNTNWNVIDFSGFVTLNLSIIIYNGLSIVIHEENEEI